MSKTVLCSRSVITVTMPTLLRFFSSMPRNAGTLKRSLEAFSKTFFTVTCESGYSSATSRKVSLSERWAMSAYAASVIR